MTKEKGKEKNITTDLQINSVTDLQVNYKPIAEQYLAMRSVNNKEFQSKFLKTFADLVFSQDEEMQEKLTKTKQNSLLKVIFSATEAGASFAKKEVYFIPYAYSKKTTEKGVVSSRATGEFTASIIFDINFQKQQLLKLDNCKKFFTAEVHEGVKIIENLTTGNIDFDGENNVNKPTVGYYACFITTEGEKYDKFMTHKEITDRLSFNDKLDMSKYKEASNNIHLEKVVVRNLLKEIPKVSSELKTMMASEDFEYAEYEVINESKEKAPNKLEQAKKEIADLPADYPKTKAKKENVDESTGEVTEDEFF